MKRAFFLVMLFMIALSGRAEPRVQGVETAFTWGLMLIVLGLLVAGTAGPLWAVWKWRGVWRVAAAVPGVIMAFVILRILIDTAIDPTSHNLWPFEILMWGGASAVAMGLLALLKRLTRKA